MFETLYCSKCNDDFLVKPGDIEWIKHKCSHCLEVEQNDFCEECGRDLDGSENYREVCNRCAKSCNIDN
jgi:phage FluMu protein Com